MTRRRFAQREETRRENASRLLLDLWEHGPRSRAQLAARNDLSKATVSAICRDLDALGLIREVGESQSGPGRPATLLDIAAGGGSAIGVEISTNYVAAMLADLRGETLWQRALLTPVDSPQAVVLRRAEALIEEAQNEAERRADEPADAGVRVGPLLGIGVGVPGLMPNDAGGGEPPQARGWDRAALRARLGARFGLPVIVDNKARAAAVGEARYGSARGAESFVYVSIGTDVHSTVDAAVMIRGDLLQGVQGRAVDAGHMVLDPHGPPCACGQRGCWQVLTDVGREVALVRARLSAGETSSLQEREGELDHRAIHQAAVERDPLALEVVSGVLRVHALGLVNLVRLFDPEMVVIGQASAALPTADRTRMDALSAMPELDLAAVVRQRLAACGMAPPSIVRATYGLTAFTLGGVSLIVDHRLKNPPTHNV